MNQVNPPETSTVRAPCARMVATSSAAPGMILVAAQVASRALASSPASLPTRARSACEKSISPFMLARVIAAISSFSPAYAASSSSVSDVTIVLSMSDTSSIFRRPVAGCPIASTGAPSSATSTRAMSGAVGQGRSTASPSDNVSGAPAPIANATLATSASSSRATAGSAIKVRTCAMR